MTRLFEKDLHEGMKVKALFKINPSYEIFGDVYLPLRIEKEYPRFYTCTVLPHRNPHRSWGPSRPYTMTIDKFDLKIGEVIVTDINYNHKKKSA